eukprot:182561_1
MALLLLVPLSLSFVHASVPHSRRMLTEPTTSCSAITAYVEVSATKNTIINTFTALSAQALFPPHSYYVHWTNLVVIPHTEDVCNVSATSSIHITNESVLLYESIGNCSAHTKVIWAQTNNAVAVLMANNDDSGFVHNIVDDDTVSNQSIDSRIPMRSISKRQAQDLQDFIAAGFTIQIKIGCGQNETYSSLLCVTDNTVDAYTIIMGEYQRQAAEYNGHPVWKMEGFSGGYYMITIYKFMFLHDAQGDSDWYWAIAGVTSSASTNTIDLKCAVGNIVDPTSCPLWVTANNITNAHINVLGSVCVPPTNSSTLCISSQQEVAGLLGTYHPFWQASKTMLWAGAWIRELSECDRRVGLFSFQNTTRDAGFMLHDWIREEGYCQSASPQNPEHCESADFNVTIGACTDTPACVKTEAPERFCLANSSVIGGSVMGEYVRVKERGTHFNSSIYKRLPPKDASWIRMHDTLYIWYVREAQAEAGFPWGVQSRIWVLSPLDLQEVYPIYAKESYPIYATCYGYAYGNPANCEKWLSHKTIPVPDLIDPTITSTEGQCVDNSFPNLPASWPQYICLYHNISDLPWYLKASYTSAGPYVFDMNGTHAIKIEMNDTMNGTFPIWSTELNNYEGDFCDQMFLSFKYDGNMQYWEVTRIKWKIYNPSTYIHGSKRAQPYTLLTCDPYYRSNSLNPVICKRWFDSDGFLSNFYVHECSSNTRFPASSTLTSTVLTKAPTGPHVKEPTTAPTKAPTAASSTAPSKASTTVPLKAPTTAPAKAPTTAPTKAHASIKDALLSTMMQTEAAKSSAKKAASVGNVFVAVLGIIVGVMCVVVIVALFLKCKKDKTGYDKSVEKKEMITTAVDERDLSMVIETEKIGVPNDSDSGEDEPLNEP